MRVDTALRQGAKLLEDAGVDVPRLTAEVLLCHALRRERPYLYAHPEQELRQVEWLHYGRYLHERMQGKPTQYITHRQEFYGREFYVAPHVLIPRPETEHLIDACLALTPAPARVLDVGCGSGAIAVTLALAGYRVIASDISIEAIHVAMRNNRALGADVGFLACDLVSGIADQSVDLVVSNPPYIATSEALQREVLDWEPRQALFAGPEGLDIYQRLIPDAARVLKPGGWLAMELGYTSADPVKSILCGCGWRDVQVLDDLARIPRVVTARWRLE